MPIKCFAIPFPKCHRFPSKRAFVPSPVQSNCDAHDTITNGQYGAVWSMEHTQQVCVRIVLLPSNVWQQFFGRSAFLRQQETDLPPAELWCTCFFLLIGRYICLLQASYF
ncbi:hypothetical protein TNCV_448751 [Trichonephila clavipes]|nr:hypothetical protein TNCV_448751 [Trichonephila clavipes]